MLEVKFHICLSFVYMEMSLYPEFETPTISQTLNINTSTLGVVSELIDIFLSLVKSPPINQRKGILRIPVSPAKNRQGPKLHIEV